MKLMLTLLLGFLFVCFLVGMFISIGTDKWFEYAVLEMLCIISLLILNKE